VGGKFKSEGDDVDDGDAPFFFFFPFVVFGAGATPG